MYRLACLAGSVGERLADAGLIAAIICFVYGRAVLGVALFVSASVAKFGSIWLASNAGRFLR